MNFFEVMSIIIAHQVAITIMLFIRMMCYFSDEKKRKKEKLRGQELNKKCESDLDKTEE